MQAAPAPWLTAVAPWRDGLVVAVECIFTGDWRAALGAHEGLACVLGHALDRQALHGGKAKNEKSEAPKMAGLLRGGLLPQDQGDPAPLRCPAAPAPTHGQSTAPRPPRLVQPRMVGRLPPFSAVSAGVYA